jgi:hypothetical protein
MLEIPRLGSVPGQTERSGEEAMKLLARSLTILVLIALAAVIAQAAEESAAPPIRILTAGKDVKWGPPPPMIPKGAEAAILDGDPFKAGSPFTLRLKMPDGYKFVPHWHPTDENVTVINGTLGAGMGDTFDPAKGQLIKAGGFVRMPTGIAPFCVGQGTDDRPGAWHGTV